MAETTMEPWSFTIVFDEDKAKKIGSVEPEIRAAPEG